MAKAAKDEPLNIEETAKSARITIENLKRRDRENYGYDFSMPISGAIKECELVLRLCKELKECRKKLAQKKCATSKQKP